MVAFERFDCIFPVKPLNLRVVCSTTFFFFKPTCLIAKMLVHNTIIAWSSNHSKQLLLFSSRIWIMSYVGHRSKHIMEVLTECKIQVGRFRSDLKFVKTSWELIKPVKTPRSSIYNDLTTFQLIVCIRRRLYFYSLADNYKLRYIVVVRSENEYNVASADNRYSQMQIFCSHSLFWPHLPVYVSYSSCK